MISIKYNYYLVNIKVMNTTNLYHKKLKQEDICELPDSNLKRKKKEKKGRG